MFIADQLIFIHLQKTGGSHITMLLSKLLGGEQAECHVAASPEQIEANPYFVASIRNPWDWYLSLWTFGAQGDGGLKVGLTTRDYQRMRELGWRHPFRAYLAFLHQAKKKVTQWRAAYADNRSVETFRKWLHLIHAPQNAPWLSPGYGKSAIHEFSGLMTYRYLSLCCAEPWKLNKPNLIANTGDLIEFEKESCYIDFFIRQESLEDDLIAAIEKLRPLSEDEKELIQTSGKSNTSQRPLSIADYYDEESIELVRRRETVVIEKFDYLPPC